MSDNNISRTNLKNNKNSSSQAKFSLNENDTESYENRYARQQDKDDQSLADETKRKLTIKKSEPMFNTSLPVYADQLDLTEIWRAVSRPSEADEYYSFNYFTMTLNELKEEFEKVIAPTDSRFRSDIRQLELGDLGEYFQRDDEIYLFSLFLI